MRWYGSCIRLGSPSGISKCGITVRLLSRSEIETTLRRLHQLGAHRAEEGDTQGSQSSFSEETRRWVALLIVVTQTVPNFGYYCTTSLVLAVQIGNISEYLYRISSARVSGIVFISFSGKSIRFQESQHLLQTTCRDKEVDEDQRWAEYWREKRGFDSTYIQTCATSKAQTVGNTNLERSLHRRKPFVSPRTVSCVLLLRHSHLGGLSTQPKIKLKI